MQPRWAAPPTRAGALLLQGIHRLALSGCGNRGWLVRAGRVEPPTEGASSSCVQRVALGRSGRRPARRAPQGRCASAGDHAVWPGRCTCRTDRAASPQALHPTGSDGGGGATGSPRGVASGGSAGDTPGRRHGRGARRGRVHGGVVCGSGAAGRPRAGRARFHGRSAATTGGRSCACTCRACARAATRSAPAVELSI